jgi:putative membrane protein
MRFVPTMLGLLVLFLAWFGPLSELSVSPFSAHMARHMAVVALAAPALALGLAGGRFDPIPHAPLLLAPIPACALEFVVVWGFHAPALHHVARHTAFGFLLEQSTFLVSSLLLWMTVLGGGAQGRAERRGAGVLALLLTSMHMTLLGALLALAPRVLYGHSVGGRPLRALEDQQLGGVIMLAFGGICYGFGALWLTARLVADKRGGGA